MHWTTSGTVVTSDVSHWVGLADLHTLCRVSAKGSVRSHNPPVTLCEDA